MEGDRLLFEDSRAFPCGQVKAEDVAGSAHSIHHDAQDLDNEGVASPQDSLAKIGSAESQKKRTSVLHSPSKKQVNVRTIIVAQFYGWIQLRC
jgi:hypothetical protein